MELTPNECAARLRELDGFLLISHRRPDGDTVGSCAALCHALRRVGKRAYCFDNPEVTETYQPYFAGLLPPADFTAETVVTLDVAEESLFPDAAPVSVALAIDHHPSNSGFAPERCLMADKASCGEIVLQIITALCGGITPQEAELLYIAVSTDTGCFRYGNTNADTLRAAAELIDAGADNGGLNKLLFRTVTRARMALEGRIMDGLRYYRGGRVGVAVVTLGMLADCAATEDDCEDLAGIAGRVKGVIVAVTVRETAPGESKISVRTTPEADACAICAVYGGGGHKMAAGCTLYCTPEEAVQRMYRAIDEVWQES